jgi:hypothetical protein
MAHWILSEGDEPYTVVELEAGSGGNAAELALAMALARVDVEAHARRCRSTQLLEVSALCESSGESGRAFVELPAQPPPCWPWQGAHDWRFEGADGGVRLEVCRRCRCVCELQAAARGPAGQVYTRVTYTPLDEQS